MNNLNKIIYLLFFNALFSVNIWANTAQNMSYEQWKLRQQQHDIYLKQSGTTSRTALTIFSENHSTGQNQTEKNIKLGEQVKVNINTANAQELSAKLDNIGQKKAQAIIKYRKEHGDFQSIDEFKNVKGIGDVLFEKNKDRIKIKN